jgi:hypothetical protein
MDIPVHLPLNTDAEAEKKDDRDRAPDNPENRQERPQFLGAQVAQELGEEHQGFHGIITSLFDFLGGPFNDFIALF